MDISVFQQGMWFMFCAAWIDLHLCIRWYAFGREVPRKFIPINSYRTGENEKSLPARFRKLGFSNKLKDLHIRNDLKAV
jgi:hypothetical protein